MNIILRILSVLSRYRYVIVILLAVVVLGFVGDNSYMAHLRRQNTISQLRDEIETQEKNYQEYTRKLEMLETDVETVKEVARERYFMKAANEDVFIIQK